MAKKKQNAKDKIEQKASKGRKWHSAIDKISNVMDKIGIVYLVVVLSLVFGALLICYCAFPPEIREVFTPVVGGLFSLVIIPFVLEERKHTRDIKEKSFERNADLYREYLAIAVGISQEDDANCARCDYYKVLLKKYTANHYLDMCLQFPSDLYWEIHRVAAYLEKKDMSVAKYYTQKSISLIRKQAGLDKTECNSDRLLAYYSQNGKVSK